MWYLSLVKAVKYNYNCDWKSFLQDWTPKVVYIKVWYGKVHLRILWKLASQLVFLDELIINKVWCFGSPILESLPRLNIYIYITVYQGPAYWMPFKWTISRRRYRHFNVTNRRYWDGRSWSQSQLTISKSFRSLSFLPVIYK